MTVSTSEQDHEGLRSTHQHQRLTKIEEYRHGRASSPNDTDDKLLIPQNTASTRPNIGLSPAARQYRKGTRNFDNLPCPALICRTLHLSVEVLVLPRLRLMRSPRIPHRCFLACLPPQVDRIPSPSPLRHHRNKNVPHFGRRFRHRRNS